MRTVRVPRAVLREVVGTLSADDIDESAVPSYAHWNPAVRWVFWRRLETALALGDVRAGEAVLDYGTGSGVMLPTLAQAAVRVVATDLHIAPPRALIERYDLPVDVVPLPTFDSWVEANAGRLDCIFALDVLEHVDEPDMVALGSRFRRLLGARGRLVVSGPTETGLYRLARRLAGFRGQYHHRTVYDIDRMLRREWHVDRAQRVPGLPMPQGFRVTRYRPR